MADYSIFIPPVAFIGGIIIQCLSLLKEKPPRWGFITFFGMLIYLVILMSYALSQSPGWPANKSQSYIPLIMTTGMVIAILFIMIFLKSITTVINESVIVSNTISFWFLVFEWRSLFSGVIIACIIIAGIIMGVVSTRLILARKKILRIHKYLLYGWYLFVNGLFAVSYFKGLPVDFQSLPSAVNKGGVSALTMLVIGMIAVHVFFNFGILYYSVIYSLMSSETRKGLMQYSETLFSDAQVRGAEVIPMTIIQTASFIIFEIFLSPISYQLIALWILLTPIIVRVFHLIHGKVLNDH